MGNLVVALHPNYTYSYAPGRIIKSSNDNENFLIKFFDNTEDLVHKNEVFKLDVLRFKKGMNTINYYETSWKGLKVIARNSETNTFETGL